MRGIATQAAVSLILALSLLCFEGGKADPPAEAALLALTQTNQRSNNTDRVLERVLADVRRRQIKEDQFIDNFLRQPPAVQVKLWRSGKGPGSAQRRMEDLLVATGVEAAPYLAEIVRTGKTETRLLALSLLCRMDRFVPADQILFPEVARAPFQERVEARGLLDRFMVVDGRRIGSEAYAAVAWAAGQTGDRELRFHARLDTGLMDQDLRQLPLRDLVKQWREATVKSKGLLRVDADAGDLAFHLMVTLVEQAPESLPDLINILENDPSGFAREEAIEVVSAIDSHRMRLRKSEVGRRAVESIRRTLERGGLKPVYVKGEERERLWRRISARVFDDKVSTDSSSDLSFYAYALERLHGVKVTSGEVKPPAIIPDATPEMCRFYAYLTELDPFFPSWEYVHVGSATEEIIHPRFRHKIARYYEAWLRFKGHVK